MTAMASRFDYKNHYSDQDPSLKLRVLRSLGAYGWTGRRVAHHDEQKGTWPSEASKMRVSTTGDINWNGR